MLDEPRPPAGWYPHPSMVDSQRYWDGQKWTDHIAPGAAVPASPPNVAPKEGGGTLFTVGMVMAFLLPIVGFVLGCRLAFRKPLHGLVVVVVSVGVTIVGAALLQPYVEDWTGPSTLEQADVEKEIGTWAEQQIDSEVSVICPASMPVETGATYSCNATALADGSSERVVVTVSNEDGAYTWNWG